MDRINGSFVAPDLHGAGKDGFKDGNKALGIPATIVNAEFMNSLQEEIANVIEAQGIVLNIADKAQLKQAIELMVKGGDYKASVRVASTAAINLAAPGANIDGVAMVAGDRFLEKDNATLADRGIYIWNGAAVPATRALDADNGAEFNGGAIIPVEEGTVNADTNWQLTTDGVITIGVTGLIFSLANNFGLKAANIFDITATGAISNTWAGATVLLNSAAAFVPTLPAAAAVSKGLRLEFLNVNSGVATITRAGADSIKVSSTTVNSVALSNGDTLTLESDGVSTWYAVGGSRQLGYASDFFGSSSASGYQKLPSGLIIQWGTATIISGGTVTATFPIAFPNAVYQVVPGLNSSNPVSGLFGFSGLGLSSVGLYCNTNAGVGVNATLSYIVFGR